MQHKKLIASLVAIFILCLGILTGCGGDTEESSTDLPDTPQAIDLSVYKPVRSAMASYVELDAKVQGLATGETTQEDVYGYCKQIGEYDNGWDDELKALEALEDENITPYLEAADDYVAAVSAIAYSTIKYIDENDHESYQFVKETISLMPNYEADVKQAREDYLKASGLAENEINTIIANG